MTEAYVELIGIVRDNLERDVGTSRLLYLTLLKIRDKLYDRRSSRETLCVECDLSTLDLGFYLHVNNIVMERVEESSLIGKEVGGVIYKTVKGVFVEDLCVVGNEESIQILNAVKVDKLPEGIECLVEYHTHPFIDSPASPSRIDEKASDWMQYLFDKIYFKRIPVFMVIGAPEGIKWYQSTLNDS